MYACKFSVPQMQQLCSFTCSPKSKWAISYIECSFGCVAHSAVLLKPNVGNILLFNFCEQKFVKHGAITIAIDCFMPSCSFSKKNGPIVVGASAFQCMHADFLYLKCNNFACLHTRQYENELHLKRWFFFLPKSASPISWLQALLFKRIHSHIRSAEG